MYQYMQENFYHETKFSKEQKQMQSGKMCIRKS